jgi:glycosyltransferase involved in cell wall biosynthesis
VESVRVAHSFLFNFSASYSQGGFKRLQEFARWFDSRGGAYFAIHPNNSHLIQEFRRNRFFVVQRPHLLRLINDWSYLDDICKEIGQPDLYYAYGIPLYRRIGRINWSHVQNVFVIRRHVVSLSLVNRLKFQLLAARFHRGFALADVVSAESVYSLQLLENKGIRRTALSVNGSDDELKALAMAPSGAQRANVAIVVGTISYKDLNASLHAFRHLRQTHPGLKLEVIGDPSYVPNAFRQDGDVTLCGTLKRQEVIERLSRARFYISTTQVENSYNAASEGAFLSEESFVSDIPPHRELLAGELADSVAIPGGARSLIHVKRINLKGTNLRSWNDIVLDTIAVFHEARAAAAAGEYSHSESTRDGESPDRRISARTSFPCAKMRR